MSWKLETGRGKTIPNPTWQQIHDALLEMDGTTSNEVVLELENVGSMYIGGGDNGHYLVVYFPAQDPDTLSVTLTDLTQTGPDITLTIQTTAEFSPRYAAQIPLVINVVEHFFQTGKLPKYVRWEKGNTGKEANIEDY